ncbi:zinc-finger-containing protein [Xenorhabdus poinarii]|nr:zinc-finger-containing protein [Xenorhabdus poinarii]
MYTPWNPNPRAIRRVNDPSPIPTQCRYCCNHVKIAHHKEVFGRILNNSRWPWFYLCASCEARVGMHPGTNIPLGTLADRPTRIARANSKLSFERMRMQRDWERADAYRWLARRLGISFNKCHFGWFDAEMCERAKNMCTRFK